MSGQVSVVFPDGAKVVTMSLADDGSVSVEVANRVGRLVDRANIVIDEERAFALIAGLIAASKQPAPTGHQIFVNVHDVADFPEPADPDVWPRVRELAAESLGRGRRTRIGPGEYTALTFLKWCAVFAASLAGAFLFIEFVAQHWMGVHLADVVEIDPADKVVNRARRPLTIATGFLLLFVYGVIAQRFTDTHRSDAHPIGPALVATAPFALAAYSIGGGAGLFQLFTVVVLPLGIIAFGMGILNPSGMNDSQRAWFNWRGWY